MRELCRFFVGPVLIRPVEVRGLLGLEQLLRPIPHDLLGKAVDTLVVRQKYPKQGWSGL